MAVIQQARRRQAAVVSIDTVGYSMLMATDAERTIERLRECHNRLIAPAIGKYGGRLLGRAGDSWLVELASADAALQFSLDVQRGLRPLNANLEPAQQIWLRAGINFGDVIEDGDTYHGTGINIAVRLQSIAKPGGITFSSLVYERLSREFDCRFREIGPRTVKNIPAPVMVYRVVLEGEEDESLATPETLVDVSRDVPGLENRPAIAVLPFRNIGDDPQQEYFSDGLTDDIINSLAQFRSFPLISRNSTFQFKNTSVDVRQIARQLGARYVVDGSVRRAGDRLRVTAGLTHAEHGHSVWSERYDRGVEDLFAVQDEIARNVAAAIEPELSRQEQFRSRTRPVENLDDWELVRRGLWHLNRLTREDSMLARDLFDRALVRNPDSIEALVELSWWHFWDVWARRGPMDGWVEMGRLARRAMALDSQDARPLMLAGTAELMQGDADLGRNMLEKAIQLNPSLAVAYSITGTSYVLAGDPEMAIEPLRTALRLSPNDLYIFHTFGEIAVARYMMGDYVEALQAAAESLRLRPRYLYAMVVRIGCLARLGRIDAARVALKQFLERRPEFVMTDVEWLPFIDRHWIGYLGEGLVLAGYGKPA